MRAETMTVFLTVTYSALNFHVWLAQRPQCIYCWYCYEYMLLIYSIFKEMKVDKLLAEWNTIFVRKINALENIFSLPVIIYGYEIWETFTLQISVITCANQKTEITCKSSLNHYKVSVVCNSGSVFYRSGGLLLFSKPPKSQIPQLFWINISKIFSYLK